MIRGKMNNALPTCSNNVYPDMSWVPMTAMLRPRPATSTSLHPASKSSTAKLSNHAVNIVTLAYRLLVGLQRTDSLDSQTGASARTPASTIIIIRINRTLCRSCRTAQPRREGQERHKYTDTRFTLTPPRPQTRDPLLRRWGLDL
jgi:hypothetical protein